MDLSVLRGETGVPNIEDHYGFKQQAKNLPMKI
jgi:hypothetical protein